MCRSFDVNGDKRVWVHTDKTLIARNLIVMNDEEKSAELPHGSFILQVTVSSVRALETAKMQDYVWAKDQY